jgi:UDP-MurNAc hydroxylase
MDLTFVGHASVLFRTHDTGLLMDPWLRGLAFNDSWALYPDPALSDETLASVTHLWISHEHPDHFSIPTLKGITPERRRKITVLFQRHISPVVVDFLRSLDFRDVVELPHARFVSISDTVDVYCRQIGHSDSCLAMRSNGTVILNLNDCQTPASTLASLRKDVGPVHLLLDQFSIAGWAGNPAHRQRKQAAARRVLDLLCLDVQALDPHWILPFASFVRFCHPMNSHMNDDINTIDDVVARVGRDRLVVMYPGDQWDLSSSFAGTDAAIEKYRSAFNQVGQMPLVTPRPASFESILSAADSQSAQLLQAYHRPLLRYVPPVRFFVTDLKRAFVFDLRKGVRETFEDEAGCDVSIDSQAAWYTFAHRWGLPTLGVSGCYTINRDEMAFRRLKKLGSAFAAGIYTRDGTRGVLRCLLNQRRSEYLWTRRRDLMSQFVDRVQIKRSSYDGLNATQV